MKPKDVVIMQAQPDGQPEEEVKVKFLEPAGELKTIAESNETFDIRRSSLANKTAPEEKVTYFTRTLLPHEPI